MGKRFEGDFKTSFIGIENVSCDRIQDSQGHYRGAYTISDFMVYKYPTLYYFELKATKGKRLSFDHIRPGQWTGLLAKSAIYGVQAGIVVHYYSEDGCLGVYYYDIRHLVELKRQGDKSVSIEDLTGVELDYRLKRVRYKYDVERWLSVLEQGSGRGISR